MPPTELNSGRPSPRRRRPSLRLRLALLGIGLGSALLGAELLLQLMPRALPASFRERYPPHGIEFFDRGILDRTPLTAIPLPYGVEPYDGPPPADLIDFGVATAADTAADRRDVPRLVVPADADGLPNATRPERPDLVLVGDSFTLYAAQHEPPGLQRLLERELSVSCLNLAIAGIGPDQELWLLEKVGLPARPKVVVWFLFGGNDVLDAFWCRHNLQQGIATHGDLHRERRAPRLLLPSLIRSWFEPPPRSGVQTSPLPPVVLAPPASGELWLFPDSLRMMSVPPAILSVNPGLIATREVLQRARRATEAVGARFLLVFLPSKEQVYLPSLTHAPQLLHRYAQASSLYGIPLADDPQQFVAALQQNRGTIEAAIAELCIAEGIQFWSATAALIAAVERGDQPYYRTDTHWRAEGQRAVVPGLTERLREIGVGR